MGRSSFSQRESFGDSVEMITSSKPRVLIASCIAADGSAVPMIPSTGEPAARVSSGTACSIVLLRVGRVVVLGVGEPLQAVDRVRYEQREACTARALPVR